MRILRAFGGAIVLACLPGLLSAQSGGFDPRAPCGATLRAADDTVKRLIASWVFGYVAASGKGVHPVDQANMAGLLSNLYTGCARNEEASLLALLQAQGGDGDSSRASAKQLLQKFLVPGADLVALTAQLVPTQADINAVYGAPLAGKLAEMYAQLFQPDAQIGPKAGQTELLVVRSTTGALKRGDAVLGKFPGGYKRVLPYFTGDYPIVRFKFVKPGKDIGMAFDGLIHVNGRWVLMPKPWRALQ